MYDKLGMHRIIKFRMILILEGILWHFFLSVVLSDLTRGTPTYELSWNWAELSWRLYYWRSPWRSHFHKIGSGKKKASKKYLIVRVEQSLQHQRSVSDTTGLLIEYICIVVSYNHTWEPIAGFSTVTRGFSDFQPDSRTWYANSRK